MGTLGAGASRLSADGTKWDLVNRFDGLPSDSVTSFAAHGDTLLIGTTRGIALWNGVEVAGALPDGFNPSPFTNGSDWITGIVVHGDSAWVSTQLGVYRSRFSQGLTAWTVESEFIYTDRPFQGIVADDTTLIALSGDTPFRHAFDNSDSWAFAKNIAGGGTIAGALRIHEDRKRILLTTRPAGGPSESPGVFAWDPRNGWLRVTDQFVSVPGDDARSFAVTVDASGRYYAADQDGLRERVGLTDQWDLYVPASPPGNNVMNVAAQNGTLYVNTLDAGIGRLDANGWRIWPFSSPCIGAGCDTTLYAPNYAFALLVDKQGHKWFGCWGVTIDHYDDSGPTPYAEHHIYNPPLINAERHTTAWTAAADSFGGRWFGMDTNNSDFNPIGIEYYDSSGVYTANFSPDSSAVRGNKVHALTVDKVGRLWVGYPGQGIDIFVLSDVARGHQTSLPAPFTVPFSERYDVQGLVAHGDTVWALTTSELIAYKRTTATRIVSYSIPAGPGQISPGPLAVARDGTVWVGTVNGIRVVHPNGETEDLNTSNSPLPDDEIRGISVDGSTGVVWIGTTRGLNRFDPGYRPPPPPPVPKFMKIKVYPNPGWLSSAGIPLQLDGEGHTYSGEVYDLRGRRLRRFEGVANKGMVWDGRDTNGEVVGPGIYFFRVESAGISATFRVILLR